LLVDLVQTTTRDGLRLDGALQAPAENATRTLPVDAFCLMHGTGGSFYSSNLLEGFAERLHALGCWVLRANTRGHDLVSTAATARGGRRQGAAYEVLDECRHDLAAWVDFLRQRAGSRVGLLGHSSGALKCLYAVAQEPALDVRCIVAVSPPRLSYSWFCSGPKAAEFLDTWVRAERLVESGQPAALLDVTFPLPFLVTAAGYLEKYGPDERYNYLRFAGGLSRPVLWTFGGAEVEGNVAFQGAPEAVRELSARQPQLAVEVVAGADHFYTNQGEEVIARVEAWLRSL
jgi:hypothetical protein